MAEGYSATNKKLTRGTLLWPTPEEERAEQAKKERAIKTLFNSPQWYYSVHKYIGVIVEGNNFTVSVDYQPKHKQIFFHHYCYLISEFLIHAVDYRFKTIGPAILRVLQTHKDLPKHLTSDKDDLISEKDAIYLLGAYDIECFDFLVMTFAIELKKSCLDYVREQLEELAEKNWDMDHLKEKVEDFVSKHSKKLVEQKEEALKGIEGIYANKHLSRIKDISPLSFILSEKIDPKEMPRAPKDNQIWEEYFQQPHSIFLQLTLEEEKQKLQWEGGSWEDYFLDVCCTRLELTLDKENKLWDANSSKLIDWKRPKHKMHEYYTLLKEIIISTPVTS